VDTVRKFPIPPSLISKVVLLLQLLTRYRLSLLLLNLTDREIFPESCSLGVVHLLPECVADELTPAVESPVLLRLVHLRQKRLGDTKVDPIDFRAVLICARVRHTMYVLSTHIRRYRLVDFYSSLAYNSST
jgi:hypothetical protein